MTGDLGHSVLFEGLADEELAELAGISVSKRYQKGEMIFLEGTPSAGFYVVKAGKVKVFKSSAAGREQILHLLGPGEPLGEIAVFRGWPFPASAEALTASELWFFPKAEFAALLTKNSALTLNMLALLSARLRRFAARIEQLALKDAPGRLAAYLLELAHEQDNFSEVTLEMPKAQVAALLGASPETLSRIFQKMGDEGWIQVEGRKIRLLDMAALREL